MAPIYHITVSRLVKVACYKILDYGTFLYNILEHTVKIISILYTITLVYCFILFVIDYTKFQLAKCQRFVSICFGGLFCYLFATIYDSKSFLTIVNQNVQ